MNSSGTIPDTTTLATNTLAPEKSRVIWPAEAHPERCPVHTFNEIVTEAPPERVWAWLVRPQLWPGFYGNAKDVRLPEGEVEIRAGSLFSWTTFGVRANTTVVEYVRERRLAWTGSGLGATAYHGWVITPRGSGSHIVTEETQRGFTASIARAFLRSGLHQWHERWLEGLARVATGKRPD